MTFIILLIKNNKIDILAHFILQLIAPKEITHLIIKHVHYPIFLHPSLLKKKLLHHVKIVQNVNIRT